MKDVIVLLPGITGSVLRKNGRDVWNISAGAVLRGLLSLGGSVQDLALRADPPDVDDLGDGVTADALMEDAHLIPGFWKIDGYSKARATIVQSFGVQAGANYFDFPYDWRRDNRVAARKLARQGREWLATWKRESGHADAKLILIGHSMGGLVARYFLEVLGGWEDTRMLVTFGTPFRGSLNALNFIANGMKKGVGPVTLIDLGNLLRSFTSVYQLLPIYPCVDTGAGGMRYVTDVDVPNLDRGKAHAAREFHTQIETGVTANSSVNRDAIHPIVGIEQPTLQAARVDGGVVEMLWKYNGKDMSGDGTVPRVSATPIELSNRQREIFAAERHGSLQNSDPVLVNVRGLLSNPDIDLSAFKGLVGTHVSLDLADVYAAGEPIAVRAKAEEDNTLLTVRVDNVDTRQTAYRGALQGDADGWRQASLDPLAAGVYRITVKGDMGVEPVTDLFAVL